jgi:SAM-dependent methyltransferase
MNRAHDSDAADAQELESIRARYQRRHGRTSEYSMLNVPVYMMAQEKERALIGLICKVGLAPVGDKRLIEIGCGTGDNLLQFLRLGFTADNVVGNDLLEERLAVARGRLPQSIQLLSGDGSRLPEDIGSFDIVLQSTVFSSILDDGLQERLARRMWQLIASGGGVLWYDFVVDNPRNPDVRGVPLKRVRSLFPEARAFVVQRMTLAPPIARAVARLSPVMYTVAATVPFLRTHVLCWIAK